MRGWHTKNDFIHPQKWKKIEQRSEELVRQMEVKHQDGRFKPKYINNYTKCK